MSDDMGPVLGAFRAEVMGALASMRGEMGAGFARVDGRFEAQQAQIVELRGDMGAGFARVDGRFEAQQAQVVGLRSDMDAGFARNDRYIELQQAQHLGLRSELREVHDALLALTERVNRIELRLTKVELSVQRLDGELRALRDWATAEAADVRLELRGLREAAADDSALDGEVRALRARVDRIEGRLP